MSDEPDALTLELMAALGLPSERVRSVTLFVGEGHPPALRVELNIDPRLTRTLATIIKRYKLVPNG